MKVSCLLIMLGLVRFDTAWVCRQVGGWSGGGGCSGGGGVRVGWR